MQYSVYEKAMEMYKGVELMNETDTGWNFHTVPKN